MLPVGVRVDGPSSPLQLTGRWRYRALHASGPLCIAYGARALCRLLEHYTPLAVITMVTRRPGIACNGLPTIHSRIIASSVHSIERQCCAGLAGSGLLLHWVRRGLLQQL